MSEIKILRASAGSGKTYRITREYIQLLFEDAMNYKHILAVTFTNKATEEMKSRILSELYNLANGRGSSYLSFLMDDFSLSSSEVKERADRLLKLILHDYSRFSIETIDSFFQRIIRSFIRELGIFASFTLELDQNRILQLGADELLDNLDEHPVLKKWLLNFTEEKIESGKSWRLGNDINALGKEIFKEDYRYFEVSISKILTDKEFLNKYMLTISTLVKDTEKSYSSFGEEAIKIIQSHSLEVEDFSYGTGGVAGYLAKISDEFKEPGSRPRNAIDEPGQWYKKKSAKEHDIISAYHAGLNRILSEAITFYDEHIEAYNTATRVRENLYVLGILTELNEKVKQYTQDKNLFMLADSAQLLNLIIAGSDAPFVYEKIGTYFKHFMIDEFQDTSRMQWENFKPLVANSLSENNTSLVVGDVKQSIYRWRNGDWKLLAMQLEKDFQNMGVQKESFDYNWRSCPNIVGFNNTIFSAAPYILQQEFNASFDGPATSNDGFPFSTAIVDAYADAVQSHPGKGMDDNSSGGKISCHFFDSKEFEERALESVAHNIEQLQEIGYGARDIAILVRSKAEGKKIADYLFDRKNSEQAQPNCNYSFISDESLFVKSSLAVSLIIAVLKYFIAPNEALYKTQVAYYNLLLEKETADAKNTKFPHAGNIDDSLPEEFTKGLEALKKLSLFAITESIIRIFRLNHDKKNLPYLFAFQDLVFDFAQRETAGIRGFIDWWEEQGINKTVSLNQEQDAIRLLTIHKAKGLEFKVVMIPFCTWALDPGPTKGNILWCKPEKSPFDSLPCVPIKYSGKLEKSFFSKEYYHEKLHSYIDNINLLYVAFTRAREVLISFSELPAKPDIKTVSSLLYATINTPRLDENATEGRDAKFFNLPVFLNQDEHALSIGEIPTVHPKLPDKKDFMDCQYPSLPVSGRIQLRLNSTDFFADIEGDKTKAKNTGLLLHELFSKIHSQSDIANAVREMEFQGKLSKDEASEISNEIQSKLSQQPFADWFSGMYDIKTEEAILSREGRIKIPDRIMIKGEKVIVLDYKFGNKTEDAHKKQVSHYKNLLRQMGYKDIEAWLWYYYLDEVVGV
ncbi:MAG: UvrD-helicase domain-containing protein [Bacteroidales bacterium]|nr:UvrD-helicase domain-containing protein [Bacteroidales bacterium]MCF8456020.1 UvrD-helicase domain-containing protein [Bacteroidales bacterium]